MKSVKMSGLTSSQASSTTLRMAGFDAPSTLSRTSSVVRSRTTTVAHLRRHRDPTRSSTSSPWASRQSSSTIRALAVMPSPYRQPGGGLRVSLRSGQSVTPTGNPLHYEHMFDTLSYVHFEVDLEIQHPLDDQARRFLTDVQRSANRVLRFRGDERTIICLLYTSPSPR